MDTWTWVWLAAGGVLMAAELAVPGLVVVFLGLAAVLVGLGRWAGWWTSAMGSLTAWFVLSLALLVGLRALVARWLPGDFTVESSEEDAGALGSVVEVMAEVNAADQRGRIRYQGSTWPAISLAGVIPAGQKARLLARDNLAWVVEPADDGDWPPGAPESRL
jgi:membrane protein implicated in regulation of membrane protease activity